MNTTYILLPGDGPTSELVCLGRATNGTLALICVGTREQAERSARAGVDRVIWVGAEEGVPNEAYARPVADLVAKDPGPVIAGRDPASRVLLGSVVANLGVPVIVGPRHIESDGQTVRASCEAFGGIVSQLVEVQGPVGFLADGGIPIEDQEPAPIDIHASDAADLPIKVVSLQGSEGKTGQLNSADIVVAVGRGLRTQEDLALINQLVEALGAELGCTRPLAEGLGWLDRDRYIGISGQHVGPKLYLALGISGQLQHVSGARDSDVIVAVNTDADAPIAAESDFFLAADLYDVVPALVAELKE